MHCLYVLRNGYWYLLLPPTPQLQKIKKILITNPSEPDGVNVSTRRMPPSPLPPPGIGSEIASSLFYWRWLDSIHTRNWRLIDCWNPIRGGLSIRLLLLLLWLRLPKVQQLMTDPATSRRTFFLLNMKNEPPPPPPPTLPPPPPPPLPSFLLFEYWFYWLNNRLITYKN